MRAIAWALGTIVLATVLADATVQAQCVGDCGGDGEVTISDLILGVNIALGSRDPADCPAFQNSSGTVDVSQLIRAVNFALNGCPPAATPTATGGAATATATVDGPTATATAAGPTATATPIVPSPTATATGAPIGAHACTLTGSRILINRAEFASPSFVPFTGTIEIDCTGVDADGGALCTCRPTAPVMSVVGGIGKLCVAPAAESCSPRPLACGAGGSALGTALTGDGNIGACEGNADCAATCEAFCAATGATLLSAGCTGFCSTGTMESCRRDADCSAAGGVCHGSEPVGTNAGRCQCQCLDRAAGAAPRPGELQCALAATFAIVPETADCAALPLYAAPPCLTLTTASASGVLANVNDSSQTIPASGVISNEGTPLSCDALRTGDLTGLGLRAAFAAFGPLGGDVLAEVLIDCQ